LLRRDPMKVRRLAVERWGYAEDGLRAAIPAKLWHRRR
jgi:hypothetical protein